MNKHTHLVHLEAELAVDLAQTRALLAQGRDEAIAELDAHRDELGSKRKALGHEIEMFAHDAEEDLKLVGKRLGDLHMLLSKEELKDLDILDHFRDRVVEAMEYAEGDMEELKQRGDAWSFGKTPVCEAWNQLARRLSLVRMHLIQEVETAMKEFRADRSEMVEEEEE